MNGSDAVWCLYVKKRMKIKQKKICYILNIAENYRSSRFVSLPQRERITSIFKFLDRK